MDAELIRKFSQYKRDGYLTESEFQDVSERLLDSSAPPPPWIARLERACALIASAQIDAADFDAIKARLFKSAGARIRKSGINLEKEAGPREAARAEAGAVAEAEAAGTVRTCVIVASLIGLLPLPVADAPFLIITQYVMLRKLCAKFGRKPGASVILILLSALLGPLLFGLIAKRIPIIGSIVGACIAGGFTWYIGQKVRVMLVAGMEFTPRNFIKAKLD